MLEKFYNNIVEALKRAASEVLTNIPKRNHKCSWVEQGCER